MTFGQARRARAGSARLQCKHYHRPLPQLGKVTGLLRLASGDARVAYAEAEVRWLPGWPRDTNRAGIRLDGVAFWPGEVGRAGPCDIEFHDVPTAACRCGIELSADLLGVREMRTASAQYRTPHDSTTTAFAVWGNIVQHERGMRAQFAYPIAIELHALNGGFEYRNTDRIGRQLDSYGGAEGRFESPPRELRGLPLAEFLAELVPAGSVTERGVQQFIWWASDWTAWREFRAGRVN